MAISVLLICHVGASFSPFVRSQDNLSLVLLVGGGPEPTQSSPARPAKCVGGNAEQQRVQSTVDIPQWKGQVRFQDGVDGKDRVRPHNHIDLHQ